MERFCEMKQKVVINVCDGSKLGTVCDLVIDKKTGKILKIVVAKPGNFFCCTKEYRIPWHCICKMGDDIILVEMNGDEFFRDRNRKCD